MNAGAHSISHEAGLWALFLFLQRYVEVIAHSEQTTEALSAPRLRRADPEGLVSCS